MLNAVQRANLTLAADAAVKNERTWRVPASLTLAQWAVESGWGRYQPGCNCFGIKAYPGCYGHQILFTHEFVNHQETRLPQTFATFDSLADCFAYHSSLLTRPGSVYAAAWQAYTGHLDAQRLARDIAPHYATNPHYAAELGALMRDADIAAAIDAARANLSEAAV